MTLFALTSIPEDTHRRPGDIQYEELYLRSRERRAAASRRMKLANTAREAGDLDTLISLQLEADRDLAEAESDRRRAGMDPMTDLPGRALGHYSSEQLIRDVYAVHPEREASIAIIDIDGMGKVPRQVGDDWLREVSRQLRGLHVAFVMRLGGDEFGLLMFSSSEDTRKKMVEIEEELGDIKISYGIVDLDHREVGTALAQSRNDSEDLHLQIGTLLDRNFRKADEQLYEHRAFIRGKDRSSTQTPIERRSHFFGRIYREIEKRARIRQISFEERYTARQNAIRPEDDPHYVPLTVEEAYEAVKTANKQVIQADLDRERLAEDPMLGIKQRGPGLFALKQFLIQASRSDQNVSLVLIDGHQLKAVNDALGHSVGDDYVHELGKAVRAGVPHDVASVILRYEGSKVLVGLMGMDGEEADRWVREQVQYELKRWNTEADISWGVHEVNWTDLPYEGISGELAKRSTSPTRPLVNDLMDSAVNNTKESLLQRQEELGLSRAVELDVTAWIGGGRLEISLP